MAGPGKDKMMPFRDGAKLVRAFADQGGSELVVTGGEPLDHPACIDFLAEGKAFGLSTTLFSMGVFGNLRVIDSDALSAIAPHLDKWRVSIHAATAELHDALTNTNGSFDATCSAVLRMRQAGVTVCGTFFMHPGNLRELNGVVRLCGTIGIKELRVLTAVPQGRARFDADKWVVRAEEVIEKVAAAQRNAGVELRLGEAARAENGETSWCTAISEELVVSVDGWISPCHSMEPRPSESDLDNVFRRPLAEVLEDSPRLARCREVAAIRVRGCTGGCLARAALGHRG